MPEEINDSADFYKKANAMMNYQKTALVGNLLATGSMLASIVAPVVLAVNQSNPVLLALFLLWPICVLLMSAVKHGGAPFWLPAIAFAVFFLVTPVPGWYWFIVLSTMLGFHITQNLLPVLQMKIDSAFAE